MLNKPEITALVAKTVRGMTGSDVQVKVMTGTAPPDRIVTAASAPVEVQEETDALEDFISGGFGNIIVE